ncbi:DNA topoisomerase IB [Promicromonospora thailandica]|uniref:DNA topoisomerase n=1 Tax=Promicromonospora thailandica TaxID=765201 RepID=A0A9X2G4M7_9MICO|nr:DNA topoisomerase IB [Promicromonospora thailandica]MCP2267025.1 DNA topoisomerase-1 [Promicromonospora thailandica]BFF16696.1 DNA topoisomerase IB [Promicromonospora thailandica]
MADQGLVADGLNHSCDTDRGIRRRRHGKGFSYLDHDAQRITDPEVLARVRALVVPPAWTDVWICADPAGHLQATGRDVKGRKQYLYHPRWRTFRDGVKFDDLVAFGEGLADLRKRVDADMRSSRLGLDRVVATVVRLLDETLVRVGNDEYVRSGESYGLTTLRTRHATVTGSEVHFRFPGKSGVTNDVTVQDRRVAAIVRRCRELPGQRLLQYADGDDTRSVGSRDVNEYLARVTGADHTAKTFRTWGASTIAFAHLRRLEPADAREHDAQRVEAVRIAAERLHNTPAVCRKSYVHPAILADDRADLDRLIDRSGANGSRTSTWMDADERALLKFLRAVAEEAPGGR